MERTFQGQVVKRPFAPGSKSESERVFLVTPTREYELQRVGGNPFQDDKLEELVGKRVRCSGELEGYTLFLHHYREL